MNSSQIKIKIGARSLIYGSVGVFEIIKENFIGSALN